MPLTRRPVSACRTSSSLNGLMIAMMSFIDGRPLFPSSRRRRSGRGRNVFVHPASSAASDGFRNYARCHILRQKEFRRQRPLAALVGIVVTGAKLAASSPRSSPCEVCPIFHHHFRLSKFHAALLARPPDQPRPPAFHPG